VVKQAIDTLCAEVELNRDLAKFEVLQQWLVTPSSHDATIEVALHV